MSEYIPDLTKLTNSQIVVLQKLVNDYIVDDPWMKRGLDLHSFWSQSWYRLTFFGMGVIIPILFGVSEVGAPGTWIAAGWWFVFAQQWLVLLAVRIAQGVRVRNVLSEFKAITGVKIYPHDLKWRFKLTILTKPT